MTFSPQCVPARYAVRAQYCAGRVCALHAVPQAGQGYAGRFGYWHLLHRRSSVEGRPGLQTANAFGPGCGLHLVWSFAVASHYFSREGDRGRNIASPPPLFRGSGLPESAEWR